MTRILSKLFVLLALVLLIAVPVFAQVSEDTAILRFVNVIPGAASLDVYVDGLLSVSDLQFGTNSLYIPVSVGDHTVTVTQSGVTTSLWQQDVTANPNAALTLIASSTDPLGFQVFQDDLNPLPLGKARLTAIHAIATGPTVDVTLADGRAVIPSLQYNLPYGTLDVPAATYEVAVVPEGDTIENALIPVTALNLNSSTSYIVLAYGTPAEPEVLLLSAPVLPEGGEEFSGSVVRFVHGSADSPAVDLYANDTIIAPSIAFGSATDYIALPQGDYDITVRLPGESDDLLAETVAVGSGEFVTAAILGSEDELRVQTFVDDVSDIAPQQAAFSLTNTLEDEAVTAALPGDSSVEAAAGETVIAVVAPSPDAIVVTAGDSEASVGQSGGIYGGVFYSALAVPSDDGAAIVVLAPVSIDMSIESAPGNSTISTEPVALEPTTAPTEVAAAPTEAPAPTVAGDVTSATVTPEAPIATAAPASNPNQITARVLTDAGVNVHLREYPSSQALSLTLIPSGTILVVNGRPGAPTFPPDTTMTPNPEATEFVDPATLLAEDEDLDPGTTWLFVTYTPPTGEGNFTGWVNSLYLAVTNSAGQPVALASLPTVPINQPGQVNSSFVPSPLPTEQFEDQIVATVDQLAPGANLHLRRFPSTSAESLALIPSGTQVPVTGRTDTGEWYQVEYNGITGWISSVYVSLSFNGAAYDPTAMPVLSTPTPTSSPTPTAAP